MTSNKRYVIGLVGALVLGVLACSSCVTDERFRYLNDQVGHLQTRVERMEGRVSSQLQAVDGRIQSRVEELEKGLDERLAPLQEHQASTGVQMDRLGEEVLRLSGRVEENARLIQRLAERDTTEQDTLKTQVIELTERLSAFEKRLAVIENRVGIQASAAPLEKAPAKPVPEVPRKAPATPPPPQGTTPGAKPEPTDKDIYQAAYEIYQKGQYKEALEAFRGFLRKYPDSTLADNAQFWIGECYMGLKEYERAILAFQDVIKKYPKGNKVPSAMLRQAVAFCEIKDLVSCRLLLKKIVKTYPKTPEAKTAAARLEALP